MIDMEYEHIIHPIPPLYSSDSKILILGSFPSVKSRENMFFYGHPQNRFWRVVSAVLGECTPQNTEEKKHMMLKHCIALWDVIESCDIIGSSDSSITNVRPNNIAKIIAESNITRIFTNGKTSDKLYKKYAEQTIGITAINLPSTSPANAAWSVERLIEQWKIITND